MKIVEISPETAREILNSINEGGDRYQPLGLFYLKEDDKFVGIDKCLKSSASSSGSRSRRNDGRKRRTTWSRSFRCSLGGWSC